MKCWSWAVGGDTRFRLSLMVTKWKIFNQISAQTRRRTTPCDDLLAVAKGPVPPCTNHCPIGHPKKLWVTIFKLPPELWPKNISGSNSQDPTSLKPIPKEASRSPVWMMIIEIPAFLGRPTVQLIAVFLFYNEWETTCHYSWQIKVRAEDKLTSPLQLMLDFTTTAQHLCYPHCLCKVNL